MAHLSLVEMLLELLAPCSGLDTSNLLRIIVVGTLLHLPGRNCLISIGPIVDCSFRNGMPHATVAVVVHDRTDRLVDGQLLPIDAEPRNLGVEVTEVSTLQYWVVGEANAGNNVAGAKCNLLRLREVLVDIAVQLECANVSNRHKLLGPDFGIIEDVKLKVVLLTLRNDLDAELPLWVSTILNRLPEILAVEIRV